MTAAADFASAYKCDDEFWAQYVKGRPSIPKSYFDRIFDYHAQHGGAFEVAHDAGAGSGVHSARLLDRFGRVILSDAYEDNLKAARAQLHARAAQFTFMTTKLEDTIDTMPAQSVDLVLAQSMIPHTRQDVAIAAVARQLRPRGTLAISMMGMPVFTDPVIWDLWTQITQNLVVGAIAQAGGPYGPTRPVLRCQLANLDSIALSEEEFCPGALRIKMRDPLSHQDRDFMRESLLGEELKGHYPAWSQVGERDVVEYVDDDSEWAFQADYEGLRSIIMTYPYKQDSQVQKDLWMKLKEVLGDGTTEGVWPYSLILATRLGNDNK